MTKFTYHKDGTTDPSSIFVFGSNLSGWHGAGAAKVAREQFGALLGVGFGFCQRSYAIPTKNYVVDTMPIEEIAPFIKQFAHVTISQPDIKFFVTRIGCGLAGYTDAQIAPLFKECNPENCSMPEPWKEYLE